MSAPFGGELPFGDPAEAFAGGDPNADPNAQQPPDPEQPDQSDPEQGRQPSDEGEPIDLEGALAHAIEQGCEQATAALVTSAEDYMRFCQGVSYLADAFSKLQPNPDPANPASIQADQRMAAELLTHQREMGKLELDASRPTEPQPSGRG